MLTPWQCLQPTIMVSHCVNTREVSFQQNQAWLSHVLAEKTSKLQVHNPAEPPL